MSSLSKATLIGRKSVARESSDVNPGGQVIMAVKGDLHREPASGRRCSNSDRLRSSEMACRIIVVDSDQASAMILEEGLEDISRHPLVKEIRLPKASFVDDLSAIVGEVMAWGCENIATEQLYPQRQMLQHD